MKVIVYNLVSRQHVLALAACLKERNYFYKCSDCVGEKEFNEERIKFEPAPGGDNLWQATVLNCKAEEIKVLTQTGFSFRVLEQGE